MSKGSATPPTKPEADELDQVAERATDAGLGHAHQTRDDLAQAESSLLVHLALYDLLGRNEDVAVAYGDLGNLYQTLGDLAQAEAMYQEALALCTALGSKAGIASAYANLGRVHQTRGDL